MTPQRVPYFTHEEFLDREQESRFRHEFHNGRIEMMAGGSHAHSIIGTNCSGELRNALQGRDCEVHGEALMIRIAAADKSTYPDAMVICGEPVFTDNRKLVVTNPLVIVEVLSPATEAYDRGEKFAAYQLLPSLQEYVLVSQETPLVEVYRRTVSGWTKFEFPGLEATITLQSLGVTLPASAIYSRVQWTEAGL